MIRNWLCSAFRPEQVVGQVPDLPGCEATHFGFVPSRATGVGPPSPPAQLLSISKMPLSVSVLTKFFTFNHQPTKSEGIPYGLALFRPSKSTVSPSPAVRETHLAKKAFQMRLPISTHLRNSLKNRCLQRANRQLDTPGPNAPPGRSVIPPPGTRNPHTGTPVECCSSPRTSKT